MRLTDRQIAVLAALERAGDATVGDLWPEFPHLFPSDIVRVLKALERRGLVGSKGDWDQVYLGGVVFFVRGSDGDEAIHLPEPARTAVTSCLSAMVGTATIRNALSDLVERVPADRRKVAVSGLSGPPTAELTAHVHDACDRIDADVEELAALVGVPDLDQALMVWARDLPNREG